MTSVLQKDKEQEGAGKLAEDQGFKMNCKACGGPITSGKITLNGDDYHIDCFTCHACAKKVNLTLNPSNGYRLLKDLIYCGDCIDKSQRYAEWKDSPDAKRFAKKVEKVEAGGGADLGAGNYLTYDDDVSEGSLFMNWKKEELKDGSVVGYFKPATPVPGFKFKNKGGKEELTRGCKSSRMKNYYQAICNFVKAANQYESLLVFTDDSVAQVYFHLKGDKLLKLEKGKFYNLTEIPELSVGVVPSASEPFKGIDTMGRDMFLNKCEGSLNIKMPK